MENSSERKSFEQGWPRSSERRLNFRRISAVGDQSGPGRDTWSVSTETAASEGRFLDATLHSGRNGDRNFGRSIPKPSRCGKCPCGERSPRAWVRFRHRPNWFSNAGSQCLRPGASGPGCCLPRRGESRFVLIEAPSPVRPSLRSAHPDSVLNPDSPGSHETHNQPKVIAATWEATVRCSEQRCRHARSGLST